MRPVVGAYGEHVQDERHVAAALRRHVRREPVIGVGFIALVPPLIEAERRICDDDIEAHQMVALDKGRRVQTFAPIDSGTILSVKQHVQPR